MPYLLALDQGTTSSRAILFDAEGRIEAVAQEEFTQHFPQPGWVEHDAEEIWATQARVARQAVADAGLTAADLAALGITNQRETTVIWDRATGKPIHHALVWQDRRTAAFCDELKAAGHEDTFREKTGLLLDPYFSGTKVRWLLDEVPDARTRAEAGDLAFGTIDCWLLWHLTGGAVHGTDVSNASRTLLFNLHTGDWDDELLALLDIPRALLPTVYPSSHVYGATDLLGEAVPIAGIAGDQQAALFGQVCTEPGMVKNTYGTGCFLLMNTGTEAVASENRLLTTVAWQLGDGPLTYALEGSVFIGGAVVQWLRDGLGLIEKSADIEALARSVDDSEGVYLVPAFTGLGAPHWDAYARGLAIGLTRGTTAAHLARAALDSIAHQTADVLAAMRADASLALAELRCDGGAAANDFLLQIQADLVQAQVVRPQVLETTALGAAYLAGLAVGFWPDLATLAAQWQTDATFTPARTADDIQAERQQWQRAVKRAKGWGADPG